MATYDLSGFVTPEFRRPAGSAMAAPLAPSIAPTYTPDVRRNGIPAVAPLNPTSTEITYGFNEGGSALTAQQQKIADSVQSAFSNSLAQRDRDLQRYQMPQLASNIENEALARAIATANLANAQTNPYGIAGGPRGSGGGGGGRGGGGGGGGGGYRLPSMTVPRTSTPQKQWYDYLGMGLEGLGKFGPMLLGKDALKGIANKGIFGWITDKFGNPVPVDNQGQILYGSDNWDRMGDLTNYGLGTQVSSDYYNNDLWGPSTVDIPSWDVSSPVIDIPSWDVLPPDVVDYGWSY